MVQAQTRCEWRSAFNRFSVRDWDLKQVIFGNASSGIDRGIRHPLHKLATHPFAFRAAAELVDGFPLAEWFKAESPSLQPGIWRQHQKPCGNCHRHGSAAHCLHISFGRRKRNGACDGAEGKSADGCAYRLRTIVRPSETGSMADSTRSSCATKSFSSRIALVSGV